MAARDIKVGGAVVATLLNATRKPTAQKVVLTAQDGTAYVQTTGYPIKKYEIACYCPTLADREAMDDACNEGAVVVITNEDETEISGYIEEKAVKWKEWRDGHGVGKFTLIKI